MKENIHYNRIVIKISGEGFCKQGKLGIDAEEVAFIAKEAVQAQSLGKQIAIVCGGGNIIRGGTLSAKGIIKRTTADYMGMMGTLINSLALQEAIEHLGVETRVMSAIDVKAIAEPFIRRKAIRHMEKGRIVILAGGTGNPFFTTDTTAALRASELNARILMKATKVNGVYTDDPTKNPNAVKIPRLTYMEVLNNHYKIMDATAITLCMENQLPILVFNLKQKGNLVRAVQGENIGTIIAFEKGAEHGQCL
ncbi:MAG: UMP kinase [Planctomycetota bacterium]|nr:MAG: UMP kinase [Planctomycetota bacterium]